MPHVACFLMSLKLSKKRAYVFMFFIGSATLCNAQLTVQDSIKLSIASIKNHKDFSPKDTLYIDLLNRLGSELRYFNSDSLLLLSNQALKNSRSAGYKNGESTALLRIGDYYSDRGDSQKAIGYYKDALKLAKELHDPNLRLRIQNNLSGEYVYKGDYSMGLTSYLEGIEMAEAENNILMLSIMNENIANLYASQKDYTQALVFFKKVKKYNDKIGDNLNSAKTMANLAMIYADMGNHEYAMFNVNASIIILEKFKAMDWLAFAYEVKGKIYVNQKKYEWALHWYNQSEMLHTKMEDERGKIDLLNGMGEAYLGLKKDSISERYALEAFEISTKIVFLEGIQKCAKTLYKINKNKADYSTSLYYHELFQKISDTLARSENRKSLAMLKTKIDYENQQAKLVMENEKALAQQQNYVNAALAILLVFIAVTLMVHRNEKIQKRLNKELTLKKSDLEKREKELKEINETKDKLFSIIGHDLRGPIGALQGLLKLFINGEISKDEFLGFVPKLGNDVDHISFTLNNLLSWGQSQMNGAVTKPSLIAVENLVSENMDLLSEIAKVKSIKVINNIPENTLAWSDVNQIDIVIRNLMSNALKFTPHNGTITIGAKEKNDHLEVSIRDTGVGMDKQTQERIFSKNSNLTTYGTNNEKGTGLGLSLCKEMIEKNAGSIWVESAPYKGSCFYFTVPKAEEKYKKAS